MVFVGRIPGIYENWEDAKAQVHRYSDSVYKSFRSRDEAIAAFNNYKSAKQRDLSSDSSCGSSRTTTTRESPTNDELLELMQHEIARATHDHAMEVDAIIEEFKQLRSK